MAQGDTPINALIGGVASIALSFIPFAPALGGAIAGYLQGGARNDGLRVGAFSGVVAAIPLALFFVFVTVLFGAYSAAGNPGGEAFGGIVVFLFVFVFALVITAIYTVGLGALGGWLGNYVKYDTDLLE